ncbi:MAG TPA: sialidase family protein, partial [Candidatus Angelobacter sp.]|nr:sialidase family protein [Candidatus Angelobacter sp.]
MRSSIPAFLVLAFAVNAAHAQMITVGNDVQVSSARPGLEHFETQLSADPKDANLLLGCSMAFTPGSDHAETVVYVSRDGGKTWNVSLEDDRGKFSGDPTCVLGPDGIAYFAAAGYGPDLKNSIRFYRSKDSGKMWLPPQTIQTTDREYITVNNLGGKSGGEVYVHGVELEQPLDAVSTWSAISSLSVLRSCDGGDTFERAIHAASLGEHLIFAMGNAVVLSNGTLVVLYGEVKDRNNFHYRGQRLTEPNAWLKIARLPQGAERLSKSAMVSDFYLAEETPRWRHHMPALAVDQTAGPFRDRLYAAWPDIRSGRSQVLFCHSEDKGMTWSQPVAVDDDQSRPG